MVRDRGKLWAVLLVAVLLTNLFPAAASAAPEPFCWDEDFSDQSSVSGTGLILKLIDAEIEENPVGNKAVKAVSSGANAEIKSPDMTALNAGTPVSGENMIITWKFNMAESTSGQFAIRGGGGVISVLNTAWVDDTTFKISRYVYWDGTKNAERTLNIPMNTNTWYQVLLKLNSNTGLYDLYFADENGIVLTDLESGSPAAFQYVPVRYQFNSGSAANVVSWEMGLSASGKTVWFDDLYIGDNANYPLPTISTVSPSASPVSPLSVLQPLRGYNGRLYYKGAVVHSDILDRDVMRAFTADEMLNRNNGVFFDITRGGKKLSVANNSTFVGVISGNKNESTHYDGVYLAPTRIYAPENTSGTLNIVFHVPVSGVYDLQYGNFYPVSAAVTASLDGAAAQPVTFSQAAGPAERWDTVLTNASLSEGIHTLALAFDSGTAEFMRFDTLRLVQPGASPVPPSEEDLTLRDLEIEGAELVQPFDSSAGVYDAEAPKTQESVRVKVKAKDGYQVTVGTFLDMNNSYTGPIPLNMGYNRIFIVVTDPVSGVSRTTRLFVLRKQDSDLIYKDLFRPQFHYTAKLSHMNDPNGLIYNEATQEYHMYYQYHPRSMEGTYGRPGWGDYGAGWGHAVSTDLVHWEEKPMALVPDEFGFKLSGSSVVDYNNTSGLFDSSTPPESRMVAFATNGDKGDGLRERWGVALAYSTDNGYTWESYQNGKNVLDDFGDPKVLWYADSAMPNGGTWLMLVNSGADVRLFTSPNLKDWTSNHSVVMKNGANLAKWECPDLYQIAVEGEANTKKWVFSAGGSFYLVGEIVKDGAGKLSFQAETDPQYYNICSHQYSTEYLPQPANDKIYATQSFGNLPDGGIVCVSWITEDSRATIDPLKAWSGAQTVPYETRLKKTADGYKLYSYPIENVKSLRGETIYSGENIIVTPEEGNILEAKNGRLTDIDGTFTLSDGVTEFGLKLRIGNGQETVVKYDAVNQKLILDKSKSGPDSRYNVINSADMKPLNGNQIKLRVLADSCIIEIFGNDGEVPISSVFYPDADSTALEFYTIGGNIKIDSLQIYGMNSIWETEGPRPSVEPSAGPSAIPSIHPSAEPSAVSSATPAPSTAPSVKPSSGADSGTSSGNRPGTSSGNPGNPPLIVTPNLPGDDETECTFTDIDGSYAYHQIIKLYKDGIINGVSKTRFEPQQNITRAGFAAMIVRALGLDFTGYEGQYTDVAQEDWFSGVVSAAAKAGIMTGDGNGYFRPDDFITREEMAKTLMLAFELMYHRTGEKSAETPAFDDIAQISDWAKQYVNDAAALRLFNGFEDNTFRPKLFATWEQTAAVFYRMIYR